jgi:hypothetical protein
MTEFCHITPTKFLDDFAGGRTHHLVLAHLIETDPKYTEWYKNIHRTEDTTIIMDNSAFEMVKQNRPMYPPEKLIEMGKRVGADYIVMSDYPGCEPSKTIEAAERLGPEIKKAGFGTFFVPQGRVGNTQDALHAFDYAAKSPLVDYIGVSILTAPNAYGVESGNNLQRFLSRWRLMHELDSNGTLQTIKNNNKKIHFLGMVDGPNEIVLVKDWLSIIDTWDSSAAVWAAICDISFDSSPTGLINGKNEIEVNFDHDVMSLKQTNLANSNIEYIDRLLKGYW